MAEIIWIYTLFKVSMGLIPSIYGNDSGSFGIWRQDNNFNNTFYNLPYYEYNMDQINNSTALKNLIHLLFIYE